MKKSITLILGAVVATAFLLWSRQSPESVSRSRPSASGGVTAADLTIRKERFTPPAGNALAAAVENEPVARPGSNPAGLSVNGNGDIEYNLCIPAGKKFYRAAFKPVANP